MCRTGGPIADHSFKTHGSLHLDNIPKIGSLKQSGFYGDWMPLLIHDLACTNFILDSTGNSKWACLRLQYNNFICPIIATV